MQLPDISKMTACTRHESKEKTMKFKILVLTTLAVLLTACVAPLQKEQTKALLDEGIALYQKQDYQHAKPYFPQMAHRAFLLPEMD